MKPQNALKSITNPRNEKAFFFPTIGTKAIILGRLTAGPAKSRVRDGPACIPKLCNVITIVTPTIVPKYIKAPNIEEKIFADREFVSKNFRKSFNEKSFAIIPQTKIPAKTFGNIIMKSW